MHLPLDQQVGPLPSELLARGREIVAERGLHKGSLLDPKAGTCCARGAVYIAAMGGSPAGDTGWNLPRRHHVWPGDEYEAACGFLTQVVGGDIEPWNDAPERTVAEVLDALHEALLLAKRADQ